MGLTKGILLGTGAALVSVAAAQAADLPVRKAAPVEYVRICDAYGAGFFFIPGTDTCIRISGRLRADYAVVGTGDIYSQPARRTTGASPRDADGASDFVHSTSAGTLYHRGVFGHGSATTNSARPSARPATVYQPGSAARTSSATTSCPRGTAGNANPVIRLPADAQNLTGWEARARIGFDVRTNTAWGVVQAVGQLRMARTTGVLTGDGTDSASTAAGVTLEAAYVRFAGFTFGAARDNFANMPSVMYMAAGHWASFANGAQQLAYTFTAGGGLSATVAIQEYRTRRLALRTVGNVATRRSRPARLHQPAVDRLLRQQPAGQPVRGRPGAIAYRYNAAPQFNGRVDWQQGWGAIGVAGAWPVRRSTTSRTPTTRTRRFGPSAARSPSSCPCSPAAAASTSSRPTRTA